MAELRSSGRPRARSGWVAAAVAAACLLPASGAARGSDAPAPERIQAVAAVAALLRLTAGRAVPFADMPPGAPERRALARVLAAGLLAGMPGRGRDFHPNAAATPALLAVLGANALPGPHMPPPTASGLRARLRRAGLTPRQGLDAAWAEGRGLLPSLAPGAWTRAVAASVYRRYLAALAAQVAARRPVAVRLVPTAAAVAVGSLDRLRLVVLGKGGRSVGRLAGEVAHYRLRGPRGAEAGVSAGGVFLAERPGRYTVRAVLGGGWAGRGLDAPAVRLDVFAAASALAVRAPARHLVADGRAALAVTVEAVDRAGDPVVRACRGRITLAVQGGARLESPRTGAFTRTRLTLPCTLGAARFAVAAPLGTPPGSALLTARAEGVAGLSSGAAASLRLAVVAPRASAASLAVPPGPGAGLVAAGGSLVAVLRVLDQAGVPIASGRYALTASLPAGVTLAPGTPALYDAALWPEGMPLRFVFAPGLAPGVRVLALRVQAVGGAHLRVRVVAAAGPALHLEGRLLAPSVPVAAVAASTAADPADTARVQAVDAAGAPVAYGGVLTVAVTLDGGPVPPGGLTAVIAPVAGTPGAFALAVYGGSGATVRPGLYRLVVAAAAGAPPLAPLALSLRVVAPPGTGG